jgi:hypothetical protein
LSPFVSQPAAMRAVGVRNSGSSWYGAIEAAQADGYVWACLHEHAGLAEARACAEARLVTGSKAGAAWSGPKAPAYQTHEATR